MRFIAEQRRAWIRTNTHTQILDRDPDFDRDAPAFYYARVVQNPTCRWHTYLCNAGKTDCSRPQTVGAGFEPCCDPLYPKTIQERAWTSPIWYTPAGSDANVGQR